MGRKPYPDAPCVVCGKVGHPYAKGMCNSCYQHLIKHGQAVPAKHCPVPNGTVRNGWERVSFKGGVYTYRCVQCGAEFQKRNHDWPKTPHKCTYQFCPQNEAQRAVVDAYIQSQYGLNMNIGDIAKAFGASPSYVYRLLFDARRAAQEGDSDA